MAHPGTVPRAVAQVTALLAAALVLVPVVLDRAWSERLWGIGFSHTLWPPLRIAVAGVALAAIAAAWWRPPVRVAQRLADAWPLGRWGTAGLVCGLGALAFGALPVRHWLLGDGSLLLGQLRESKGIITGGWGALAVLSAVHGSVGRVLGWEPATTFRVVTGLCGVIYLACGLRFAELGSDVRLTRGLAFMPFLGTAFVVQFFGYPEL
ncbi:MAG: hypothetical protein ABIL09_16285 [Gemmatimonadota bacterium]